uniref:Methyltransferase FkbM domain-containing protein n=1 Tax=viral metagenome TaxID=1070528 RepID=A0A6C0JDY2_9ZZZZ
MENDNTYTYLTHFGKITLYQNELFIGTSFRNNQYWDEDTLWKLKEYIDPNRNMLEIGGHCGTSSVVYASFLNPGSRIYVYEPQKKLYDLLVRNVNQNNLQDKITPHNSGVFCFNGESTMHDTDLDGWGGNVAKRYDEEINDGCNFGGIGLGLNGETIKLTTIDDMGLDNIGFIHCDAQGSENFIFAKGLETIKKSRPVVYYENIQFEKGHAATVMFKNICDTYPEYSKESQFDIKKYCMEELGYSECIDRFNDGIDTLLIP